MGIRRICLMAGPGAGKSTLAMRIASFLKAQGIETEYSVEWVKTMAFLKVPIAGYDQLYIMAKQMRQEDIILRNSGSIVVTDSPPLMTVVYAAKKYHFNSWKALRDIALDFESNYRTLNIFVDRSDLEYSNEGRYENKDEAIEIDNSIKEFLEESGVKWETVRFDDLEGAERLALSFVQS